MQKKIDVLKAPSRTTRFQEARYRITPASRNFTKNDSALQQFLLSMSCCHELKEGKHKPDCKGYSIGEMKECLHSTEIQYLEGRVKGEGPAPLWEQTIKLHNEICAHITKYIAIALRSVPPAIERVT